MRFDAQKMCWESLTLENPSGVSRLSKLSYGVKLLSVEDDKIEILVFGGDSFYQDTRLLFDQTYIFCTNLCNF